MSVLSDMLPQSDKYGGDVKGRSNESHPRAGEGVKERFRAMDAFFLY